MIVISPPSRSGRGFSSTRGRMRHLLADETRTTLCGRDASGWPTADLMGISNCTICAQAQELRDTSTPAPERCSECRRPIEQPARGRKRDTCSAECARARTARLKRRGRAEAKNAERQINNPVERAYMAELRHWMRTGEEGPRINRSTPPTIVSTWLQHREGCRPCR